MEAYFHNLFPLVFPFRYWRWGWTCSKLVLITESWHAPNLFIDMSRCRPFTEDSRRASSAWSRMQVWSVQFIRWDRTTVKHYICGYEEDAFIKCLFCDFSQSWAGQKVIQPTTVTPNCSSSVLWPLLQDKWPVTLWQWSGLSSKHKVYLCIFPEPSYFNIFFSKCLTICFVFQLSAQIHVQLQVYYKDL